MIENAVSLTDLLEKGRSYPFHSLSYVDPEELTDVVSTIHTEDYCLILQSLPTYQLIHWGAKDEAAFLEAVTQIIGQGEKGQKFQIEFVPEQLVPALSQRGFQIAGEFVDFFKQDLEAPEIQYKLPIEIRPIQPGEYEAAAGITQACRGLSRGFRGETTEFVEEWAADPDCEVFLGFHGEELVGVLFTNVYGFEGEKGPIVWIRELAVAPQHQSKGVGYQLIRHGLSWGKAKGATRSFLAADVENAKGIKLYEGMGYQRKEGRGQINMIYEKLD